MFKRALPFVLVAPLVAFLPRGLHAEELPDLPENVTSFGAAIAGDALYVYGGHTGGAHKYFKSAQANVLRRLSLKNPKSWESLGQGPGLQGLAMVAHHGRLYRIGGFQAKNAEGEPHDLWSQANVDRYDPATGKWQALDPLPEPRSSFDAAVLDDKIYVVGGWQLRGDDESVWHKTAHVLDLRQKEPTWQPVPSPGFERRALAVAAHNGKLYAIGGMQRQGGATTRADLYDPAKRSWLRGPNLPGKGMEGFGASAFAVGNRLYVSTYGGNLLRLAKDGGSWETVKQLERARFFHRMLPLSDHQLLSVGGANMSTGKFEELDVIELSPEDKAPGCQ